MRRKRAFRLPRLSRRGKIIRNTAAALLAAVTLWRMLGYPLPARLAYRRLEREHFLSPADIQVVCDTAGEDRQVVFAVREDQLYWGLIHDGNSGFITAMEWDGSPLLLCNGWMINEKTGLTAAALGAPEEAVSARLELTLTIDGGTEVPETHYWFEPEKTIPETWSEYYTQTTWRQGDVFQFQIPRKYPTVTVATNEKQRKAWNDSSCEYWGVINGMSAGGEAGYHYDMRAEFYGRSGEVVLVLEQNERTGLAADFWH